MTRFDRFVLAFFVLAQNPAALVLALVAIPILIVFALYLGVYVGGGFLVAFGALKLAQWIFGTRKATQSNYLPLVEVKQPSQLLPSPALLEAHKGPQKW